MPSFICEAFPALIRNCCTASVRGRFCSSTALEKGAGDREGRLGAEGVLSVQEQLPHLGSSTRQSPLARGPDSRGRMKERAALLPSPPARGEGVKNESGGWSCC